MSKSNGARRVVVTGHGAVTPIGIGIAPFWESVRAGRCGIGEIKGFDTSELYIHIAGEVDGFDARKLLDSKHILLADRYSQFAGVAAKEAMSQAGFDGPVDDGLRAACIIGSGIGGLVSLEKGYEDLFRHNKKATHPLTLLRSIGSSAAAHVGIDYGIKGPCFGTVSACSTAAHAIGLTFQLIRGNAADLGVAGASEAALTFGSLRAWQAMRVLSPDGCYPFSKHRNGTVLAEGAGVLVLEELEHARERGANILAEVLGFGMTADAGDMVNPGIEGPTAAMQLALDDAAISPGDIDYLNAHGTATAINDVNETGAIRRVFGNAANDLLVSSTKSMTGHTLGAGGSIEASACLMAMQDNFAPPTIGFDAPGEDCDLDYVPNEGREHEINYTMSNSFAFGGLNAVLVFGPAPA
ncbi:MAG: beta-ketoacyl-[acyl-carrier-protein] synthase family protein [Dichotomicrobium sp.]